MIGSRPNERSARAAQRGFVLRFILIAAVLFALYSFPYAENGLSERWFDAYLSGYARIAGDVFAIFERGVIVTQNVIAGRFSLRIVKSCDAMEVNLLFCTAVLAYPARVLQKFAAVSLGLTTLVAVNVLRICCLYFAGVFLPSWFELLHFEVWPLLLVVYASALFFGWIVWVRRSEPALASD